MEFAKAAAELLTEYQRTRGAESVLFANTKAYRQFIEAAEQAGLTGPEIEMDEDFARRSPEWVAKAGTDEIQRWIHTLIRVDRWNGDCPDAVLTACKLRCISALVKRLASS